MQGTSIQVNILPAQLHRFTDAKAYKSVVLHPGDIFTELFPGDIFTELPQRFPRNLTIRVIWPIVSAKVRARLGRGREYARAASVHGAEKMSATVHTAARPGRNAPCRCGSGRKYKHCCLPKESVGEVRGARPIGTVLSQSARNTEQILQTALVFHQQGDLQQAERLYRDVLQADPTNTDALHLLGVLAHQEGDHSAAVDLIGMAITRNPLVPDFHDDLALALQALGRRSEAIEHFRQALRLKPAYPEGHNNLGSALREHGDLSEAIAHFRQALRLKPDLAEARSNLGLALLAQGHVSDAVAQLQEAVRLEPDNAETRNGLGMALQAPRDLPGAIEQYRWAIKLKPDYAPAYNNLGLALLQGGDVAGAAEQYRLAMERDPTYAEPHLNLGGALDLQGNLARAVAQYEEALRLQPDYPQAVNSLMHDLQELCDWEKLPPLIDQTIELIRNRASALISPFTVLAIQTTAADQLTCARNWVANGIGNLEGLRAELDFRFEPGPKERLRIGYLSADFHPHATTYLIAELFELHDRDRFEIVAYSIGPPDQSDIRQRLIQGVDRFVDLRELSDADAALRIYRDQIDVLVDLKGYTQGCRTETLALRPAPIQVSYLGYPGTMGAPFIDYLLTDAFLTPPDQQPFFAEQLVYLPDCYQVNPRTRPVAEETPSRKEVGLPLDGFVFCSFNNSYKLTPELFTIWMRLLEQVPGSVLWLLEANRWMVSNLQREAASRGIDPARLVFAPRLALPQHLARHRLADLFLDTVPYNAHTTASDALWMGLPVLTCAGETFASRVAGSLLTAVGLPELITSSLEEYEALALHLAQHPTELTALHDQLLASRHSSALFDTPRFTRHLEAAYRQLWEKLCFRTGVARRGSDAEVRSAARQLEQP
jgi:protein O-GlcNAc transferase